MAIKDLKTIIIQVQGKYFMWDFNILRLLAVQGLVFTDILE